MNWLRAYLPLVRAGLPQRPNNRGPDGLSFAGSGFRSLIARNVTPQDLRIGTNFTGERPAAVLEALSDACRTIETKPAHFTTPPGSKVPVFAPCRGAARLSGPIVLTPELLSAWGTLSVPGHLWRTMRRLGTWIEPVRLSEWTRLTSDHAERMGLVFQPGQIEAGLARQDPARDTSLARAVARRLEEAGAPIAYVWSGAPLTSSTLDIDQTLPWSAWPCGDL